MNLVGMTKVRTADPLELSQMRYQAALITEIRHQHAFSGTHWATGGHHTRRRTSVNDFFASKFKCPLPSTRAANTAQNRNAPPVEHMVVKNDVCRHLMENRLRKRFIVGSPRSPSSGWHRGNWSTRSAVILGGAGSGLPSLCGHTQTSRL